MKVLQDVSDLSSISGLKDRFLFLAETRPELLEPAPQVKQQLHWWPRCQQILTSIKKKKKRREEGKRFYQHRNISTFLSLLIQLCVADQGAFQMIYYSVDNFFPPHSWCSCQKIICQNYFLAGAAWQACSIIWFHSVVMNGEKRLKSPPLLEGRITHFQLFFF